MKPDMKRVLEMAFEAPEPKHKKAFLRQMKRPQISTFSFLLSQLSYIRKRVWLASVLIVVCAIMSIRYVGADSVWIISAMMPFVALCAVTENARSTTYGMAELEMAARFSLKSITLARLSAIGLFHFVILGILVPVVCESAFLSYVQVGIYLLVPYLLTSVLGLMATRKMHGKEAIYVCVSISVMVSFLNLVLRANIPQMYEEKQFIWWCVFAFYLIVKVWKEYQKTIYQTEELAWN